MSWNPPPSRIFHPICVLSGLFAGAIPSSSSSSSSLLVLFTCSTRMKFPTSTTYSSVRCTISPIHPVERTECGESSQEDISCCALSFLRHRSESKLDRVLVLHKHYQLCYHFRQYGLLCVLVNKRKEKKNNKIGRKKTHSSNGKGTWYQKIFHLLSHTSLKSRQAKLYR